MFGYHVIAVVAFGSAILSAQAPVVSTVEPRSGPPGTVLTLKGVALGADRVKEVYLTDHRFNLMVKVLEQDSSHAQIRIPPFAKVGRYQVLFLSDARGEPVLLEQPVYVVVEEGTPIPPSPGLAAAPGASRPAPAGPPNRPAEDIRVPATQAAAKAAVVAAPEGARPAAAKPAPPLETAEVVAPQEEREPEPAEAALNTPLEVVKKVPPVYSTIARQMRLFGSVTLQVNVDGQGKIRSLDVQEGNPVLASAATDCVRRWTFKPATVRGKPVASSTTVKILFPKP